MLRGRRHEHEVLDRLLEAVRGGESRVYVVRGEPGVGKSALLEYVADRASECRVARAVGVQSEMELAFAGLDQLCAPMLAHIDRLPGLSAMRCLLRSGWRVARHRIAFWCHPRRGDFVRSR
jgi:AAA ATPase domain